MACVVAAAGLAITSACAPAIEAPIDHQRAIDRDDGDRLAVLIAQLPGVVRADVVLHHATRDPLAIAPASPAVCSAVVTTDDRANPEALRAAITRLARAAVPELAADAALPIELNPAVHRAELARVGPFAVEAASQAPLRAALSVALLAIIGLASVVAVRGVRDRRDFQRRGSSAQ
ncbi:MAG TPA: hypothetical protein VFP84_38325 [Kofleriaceae bacterium]|nr:hypothetical protein [Kofleriaceae bacterium]